MEYAKLHIIIDPPVEICSRVLVRPSLRIQRTRWQDQVAARYVRRNGWRQRTQQGGICKVTWWIPKRWIRYTSLVRDGPLRC